MTMIKKYIPSLSDKVAARFPPNKWSTEIQKHIQTNKEQMGWEVDLTTSRSLLRVVCGLRPSPLEFGRLKKDLKLSSIPKKGRGYLFSELVLSLATEANVFVSLKAIMRAYRLFFGVRVHGDYPIMVANYGNYYVVADEDLQVPSFEVEAPTTRGEQAAMNVIGLLQRMSEPNKYSGEETPTYTTDDKELAPTEFGVDQRFVGGVDSRDKYKQKKTAPTLSSVLRDNGKLDEADPKKKPKRRSKLRDLLVEAEKEEETEFIGANDKDALREKQMEEDERKLTEALGMMNVTEEPVEPPKIVRNPRTGDYSINPEHPVFERMVAITPKHWKTVPKVAQSFLTVQSVPVPSLRVFP